MILKSFYINGVKVEFTTFGVKIYTKNFTESEKIRAYLVKEGLIEEMAQIISKNCP